MSSPRSSAIVPTEEELAIIAAGDNMATPGSADCTQPGNEFGPYWSTLSSDKSLGDLRHLCHVPEDIEFVLPAPNESPESVRPGYCCAYEVYFKGCGLPFPIPELLLLYLEALDIALPQCTPNLIRNILCAMTVAMEANFAIGLDELSELFSVRIARGSGTFTLHPRTDRALFDGFPLKDENWRRYWFFFKINESSVGGFDKILKTKFLSGPADKKLKRPAFYQGFFHFFKEISEQRVHWNSFTIQRLHRGMDMMRRQFGRKIRGTFDEDWSELSLRERRGKEVDMLKAIATLSEKRRASPSVEVHRNAILVNDGSSEAIRVFGRPPSPPPGSEAAAKDGFDATLASLPRRNSKKRASDSVSDPSTSSKRTRPEMPPPPTTISQSPGGSSQVDSDDVLLTSPHELSFPPELTARADDSLRTISDNPSARTSEVGSRVDKGPRVQGPRPNRSSRRAPNPAFTARDRAANVFKHLGTREGDPVPDLERWRPEVRDIYSRYAHHAAQCAGFVTSLVYHYESEVIPKNAGSEALQNRVAALEKSGKELKEALVQSEARASSADILKKELEKAQELGKAQEQKIRFFEATASSSKEACEAMNIELHSLKTRLKEQELKNEALVKLREHDLKVSAHSARKTVKTRGQILFDDVSEYFRRAKARKKVEAELVEINSNKLLLAQVIEGKITPSNELEVLDEMLKETNEKISSLPSADFDLQKYAEYFVDSPPVDETGPSLTCEENISDARLETSEKDTPSSASAPAILEVNFIIPPFIYQFGSNFVLLGNKQVSELRTPAVLEANVQHVSSDVPTLVSEKDPEDSAPVTS